MKGKLIKTDVNFLLEDDKGVVIASTSLKRVEGLSLSLKNCQAIEFGYDLDELKRQASSSQTGARMFFSNTEFISGWEMGFQKALELMGDKKFSEEDINTAYSTGYEDGKRNENFWGQLIQSLQQTEWDVEIVMEKFDLSFGCYKIQTKFDKDGCLILKRI